MSSPTRSVGRSDGRSVVRSFPRLGLTLPLSELDTGTCIYYPGQVQDSVPLSVLLQAPPDSSRVTMLVSSQQQCWSVGWLCWREATRTFAAKNYPAQVLMIKLLITTRRRSDSVPRSLEWPSDRGIALGKYCMLALANGRDCGIKVTSQCVM